MKKLFIAIKATPADHPNPGLYTSNSVVVCKNNKELVNVFARKDWSKNDLEISTNKKGEHTVCYPNMLKDIFSVPHKM